jgi:hypothetical protein
MSPIMSPMHMPMRRMPVSAPNSRLFMPENAVNHRFSMPEYAMNQGLHFALQKCAVSAFC